jgi:hypothetical protein
MHNQWVEATGISLVLFKGTVVGPVASPLSLAQNRRMGGEEDAAGAQ